MPRQDAEPYRHASRFIAHVAQQQRRPSQRRISAGANPAMGTTFVRSWSVNRTSGPALGANEMGPATSRPVVQVHGAPPFFYTTASSNQTGPPAFNRKTVGANPPAVASFPLTRVAQPAEARRRERRKCGCESCREDHFSWASSIEAMQRTFNPPSRERYPGGPPISSYRPLVKQDHGRLTSGNRGGGTFTGDQPFFAAVRSWDTS